MAGGNRQVGPRSPAPPVHGSSRASMRGDRFQRGGRSGALDHPARWTEIAETGSVSNGAFKLTELTSGGVRWQVLPEWHPLLFGPNGFRLDEWLRSGRAHVVKNGPHRTVYRVALPGLSVYLK